MLKKLKKLFSLKFAFAIILLQYLVTSFAYPVFASTTSYTYDANGNMTSDGTNCYTYNEANQLSQVKNCGNNQVIAQYVYDANGNRIIKKNYTNGVLNNTVYSPEDEFETKKLANNSTQNTTYYFANGQQIAKKNPDGTKEYIQNDQLGSSGVVTNQAGNLAEQTNFDPWGNVLAGGTQTKFQYTGQEKDSETGLNYYNARYYSPTLRRFTQPDTLVSDVYNPQDLNRYSYVGNNPVKNTDPSGHNFLSAVAALTFLAGSYTLIGAELGGAIIGAIDYFIRPPAAINVKKTTPASQTSTVSNKKQPALASNPPINGTINTGSLGGNMLVGMQKGVEGSVGQLGMGIIGVSMLLTTPGSNPEKIYENIAESTGRNTPVNLSEQLALEQIMADPTKGKVLSNIVMGDPRWPASQGWVKMEQSINGINIHWNLNTITGRAADFKFK